MTRWVVVALVVTLATVLAPRKTVSALDEEPFVGCHCCPIPAHCNPN